MVENPSIVGCRAFADTQCVRRRRGRTRSARGTSLSRPGGFIPSTAVYMAAVAAQAGEVRRVGQRAANRGRNGTYTGSRRRARRYAEAGFSLRRPARGSGHGQGLSAFPQARADRHRPGAGPAAGHRRHPRPRLLKPSPRPRPLPRIRSFWPGAGPQTQSPGTAKGRPHVVGTALRQTVTRAGARR